MRRAKLGLAGQTTPLDNRVARRLHRDHDTAVLVAEVMAGGPAEGAKVQAGDVILEFAGRKVFTIDDLHRLLTAEVADQEAELTVLRRAKIETLTLRPELDD